MLSKVVAVDSSGWMQLGDTLWDFIWNLFVVTTHSSGNACMERPMQRHWTTTVLGNFVLRLCFLIIVYSHLLNWGTVADVTAQSWQMLMDFVEYWRTLTVVDKCQTAVGFPISVLLLQRFAAAVNMHCIVLVKDRHAIVVVLEHWWLHGLPLLPTLRVHPSCRLTGLDQVQSLGSL